MADLTVQQVANLVIGKELDDQNAFRELIRATTGKPLDFVSAVFAAVPEPGSNSECAPDAMQMSALSYLGTQSARLIAVEVLQATEQNMYKIAKKCRMIFHRTWTAGFLVAEVENKIHKATKPGVVYNILGLTMMGEPADELIAMYLAEK